MKFAVILCLMFYSGNLACAYGLEIPPTTPEMDASIPYEPWMNAPPYERPDASWPENQPTVGNVRNDKVR